METDILADVSTYLGDEVSVQDNPVLLIIIKKKRRFQSTEMLSLMLLFFIGLNKAQKEKVLTTRTESAELIRAKMISILMWSRW